MPPKRKRAEEPAAAAPASSSRPTRSSTRNQAKAAATTQEEPAVEEEQPAEPVTKRKRASTTTKASAAPKEPKKPAAKKTTAKKGAKSTDDAEPAASKTAAAPAKSKATAAGKQATTNPPPEAANGSHPSLTSASVPNGNTNTNTTTTTATTTRTSTDSTKAAAPRPATPPPPVAPQPAQPPSELKVQPYTAQRSLALFQKYADSDDPKVIGPEGFEALCSETGIPLEGALPLILAWQVDAKEMAKISKEEWVKGMDKLKIASLPALAAALNDLQNLLIMGQGVVPAKKGQPKKDQDVYDKTEYMTYAADTKAAFRKLYNYCFALAKPEGSRNIDMETSCAFWSVLLVPQHEIMKDILEFIAEKGTYKATNKDLWSMMLEFCQTVNPSLKDYESDGAWPTLLDDFVTWKKEKLGIPTEAEGAGADE